MELVGRTELADRTQKLPPTVCTRLWENGELSKMVYSLPPMCCAKGSSVSPWSKVKQVLLRGCCYCVLYICVYFHVDACSCVCTWRSEVRVRCLSLSTWYFETGSCWLDWLVREFKESAYFYIFLSLALGLRMHGAVPSFQMDVWDPNASPTSCTTSTLWTDPSPQVPHSSFTWEGSQRRHWGVHSPILLFFPYRTDTPVSLLSLQMFHFCWKKQ